MKETGNEDLIMELPPDAGQVARLLARRNGWAQHYFARVSPTGPPTEVHSPIAGCFCLMGAARKCYGRSTDASFEAIDSIQLAIREVTGCMTPISSWQDDPKRTQREVVELALRAGV